MNAPAGKAAIGGAAPPPKPLGRILVERGILSEDQLRIALKEQQRTNQPLGKALKNLGFVTEATLRDALSENLGATGVDLAHIIIDPAAIKALPPEFAKRHMLFPLELDRPGRRFAVAMADPNNVVALDQLRAHLLATTHEPFEVVPLLAGESEIARAIDQYFGYELSIDGILNEIETGEIDYQSLSTTTNEYSQPMVRLVDALLADAVQRSASDIHFEPEQNFLRIRYRIDGVLRQIRALHKQYWPAMVVRIKVISQMNIAETRAPQDGRISLSLTGRMVDFRVAAQPTTHGENIVLRILDRQRGLVPLDKLGLQEEQLGLMKLMIARPEGIILVTGPTGSGKTTTLYSILNHINSESINIMTLEDPVEYPMNMVRQTSVNEAAKTRFRHRYPLSHAPGSGCDTGGRDSRHRYRRDGVSRRHDRASGLLDPAHQFRHRRHPAPARHRHPARRDGRQHRGRCRATPGATPVPALQGGARGRSGGVPHHGHRRLGRADDLWRGRLRALRIPRLPQPHRDHGNPQDGFRSR